MVRFITVYPEEEGSGCCWLAVDQRLSLCPARGLGAILNHALIWFVLQFLQAGRTALPPKRGRRPRKRATSGAADTAERGFILQDAQHTSNRGRGSSPKEKGPIIAFIKTSLGWKSFGGLSTPMGTGFPQLHRQPCSCSEAKLGKSRSRREDLGRQEKARVCFQCRKAGEFISAM